MKILEKKGFLSYFPERLRNFIDSLDGDVFDELREIRIRKNAPLSLSVAGFQYFADIKGNLSVKSMMHPFEVTEKEFEETVDKITNYSFFSHTEEIINGFITLPEGHRVGICGGALYRDGSLSGITDITTLIFRISRDIDGISRPLINEIFAGGLKGTVIAGEPCSGKTTLVKDMAKQLSNGAAGKSYSVALIDERYEIAGRSKTAYTFEILSGFKKSAGILQAVRTLSPDVVICDELGSSLETDAIISGFNSGVPVITTIHASGLEECLKKPQLQILKEYKAFEYLVLLEGRKSPSKIKKIIKREEFENEMDRYSISNNIGSAFWQF